jgi:cysteinyl-tRNA synthetase
MREPAHFTRATQHIPAMIALIEKLLQKGVAYRVGGNVYFDVTRFPGYGKLSGNSLETLKAGARVEIHPDKKHPADFALWKTDEKHLMQWDAPWGRGFPGWHIECSAMAMQYLGETFDVHTGGEDNIFPHHECEIAQSEAATGKKFVRMWLHARHMLWSGQKISKSLGNVVLIQDLLDKGYTAQEIRFALVRTRYREQVNFSWQLFDEAKKSVTRLLEFKGRLREAAPKSGSGAALDLDKIRREFEERLEDDLDVAGALGVVLTMARDGNRLIDEGLGGPAAQQALALLGRFDEVFAVLGGELPEKPPDEVVRLAQERVEARKRKDFKAADQARDQIRAMGWSVEDTKDGVKFRRS